jgi:hypothetical protein
MLTQNKDIGLTLLPLFLARPLRTRYSNSLSQWRKESTVIHCFIPTFSSEVNSPLSNPRLNNDLGLTTNNWINLERMS